MDNEKINWNREYMKLHVEIRNRDYPNMSMDDYYDLIKNKGIKKKKCHLKNYVLNIFKQN